MSDSLIAIQEQIAALQAQASEIKSREMADKISQIRELMTAYGITVDQIQGKTVKTASSKSSNPAPAKYAGPNGELWTGRGLSPKWMTALIAAGHDKNEYLISK